MYDQDSGYYYLQSRYYDPEMARFINADNYPTTGQGLTGNNMFAYCGNNPVYRTDEGGDFWNLAAGAIFGGAISAISQVVTNAVTGNDLGAGVATAFIAGAISGALSASSVKKAGQIIGNALISGISEGINQYKNYKENPAEFNMGKAILSVGTATFLGGVAGAIGGDGMRSKGSKYALALENLDETSMRVASGIYNNPSTKAKLIARATGTVIGTGTSATITTSIKFFVGAKVGQYGMSLLNEVYPE